jgi:predicted  nucleic acid-binding Zn-ribbon protein
MSVSPKLQLQQLIVLQSLDDEIAEHKKLLVDIPLQIDAGCTELEEKKKILSNAKEELDALQKERKDLELAVQGENDHMAKAKTKLPAVKTNREYTAILSEVEAIKVKVSGLEDKELEIMEILEEKQKEVPGIEKKCNEEDARFQEYKAKKDAELDRIKQELGVLVAKRENVSGQLDRVIMQRYEKVAGSRDGRAVVMLQGSICQGCFQQILPQMVIDVKIGESIQQCSNCIRFLYWEEVPEAATPK